MASITSNIDLFGNARQAVFGHARLYCTIFLFFFLIVSCGPGPETDQQKEGKAPDFTLQDLNGESFHLKAERGKMVLLIFATTWCPSCREFIPTYRDLYHAYGKRGLVMVNVDIQEPLERVREFVKRNEIPYRVLLDEDGSVGMAYGIVGVPALVLINQDGEVISSDIRIILEILGKVFTKPGPSPS